MKLPVPTRPSGRSTASNVTQGIYVCMYVGRYAAPCSYIVHTVCSRRPDRRPPMLQLPVRYPPTARYLEGGRRTTPLQHLGRTGVPRPTRLADPTRRARNQGTRHAVCRYVVYQCTYFPPCRPTTVNYCTVTSLPTFSLRTHIPPSYDSLRSIPFP
jgi:hypothetical protein